jgi:hypothetical protein
VRMNCARSVQSVQKSSAIGDPGCKVSVYGVMGAAKGASEVQDAIFSRLQGKNTADFVYPPMDHLRCCIAGLPASPWCLDGSAIRSTGHYDIVGGLKAMTRIGKIRDPWCAEALEFLERKRLPMEGGPRSSAFTKSVQRPWREARTT